MPSLIWFKEDLRMSDNPALYNAAQTGNGVVAIFFITQDIWKKRGYGSNKIDFVLRNLKELSISLVKKNIPLLIRIAKNHVEITRQLLKTASKYKLEAIYFNKSGDDTFDDLGMRKLVSSLSKTIRVFSYDDAPILPFGSVLTQKNEPYTIYTPFKRKWLTVFADNFELEILTRPKTQRVKICEPDSLSTLPKIQVDTKIKQLWPAGEKVARTRLRKFIAESINQYEIGRDYPVFDGTSRLSPYLSCGAISVRECLQEALLANNNEMISGNKGILTWISELIWRDFYKHLAAAFPKLYKHEAFKVYTDKIVWSRNKTLFEHWKNGTTGFPIVDAAMRQLNQTGWMHNRLRMIAGSFLTKLLFIDWRWGEKYFAEQLIDYDFSANNGGWQWCASTGADSVPYFRIFNPELQQSKYDPSAEFIGRYCKSDYDVEPIIDYKKTRDYALKRFKKITRGSS